MSNELQKFEQQNMMAFIELRDLEKTAESIEKRKKEVREMLKEKMEEHGIKSIDNDYVKITFFPATPDKPSLDTKTWRSEDPDSYNDVFSRFNKMAGGKSSYVKVKAK